MLAKRVNSSKTKSSQNFGFYSPSLTDATSNSSAEPTLSAEASLNEGVLAELTGAFEKLVSFIPQLRLASPYEYEQALSDVLSKQFKHDELAMRGFIRVIINSMDKTLITEYIDRTIENESKDLLSESPFRIALVTHHLKWMDEVMYSLGINKAKSARRIELATLEKSLDATQYKLRGQQKTIKLFPDDNLIKVVEEILAKGKTFSTELWGVPIASSLSFDSFLSELEAINLQRLEGKLKAHAPTIISAKTDLAELLRVLLIQQDKILRSPSYQQFEYASSLARQQEAEKKHIAAHIEEESKLNLRIQDLERQLAQANQQVEKLKLADQARKQQVKMNSRLKRENAYLNQQMIQIAQETDREEVLLIVKDTLIEKPRYTELQLFSLFQSEGRKLEFLERSTQSNGANPSLITFGDTHYVRRSLVQNNDTPFYLFGLNRQQAHSLLMRNIHEVRENMSFFWRDIPIGNEAFVKSISADYTNLRLAAEQYIVGKQKKVPDLKQYARRLKPYLYDFALLQAYIDYDVQQAQLNGGWCHPALLTALAEILDIQLIFYVIDHHGKMVVHPDFRGCEVISATEQLELLMSEDYRFERVLPCVSLSKETDNSAHQGVYENCHATPNSKLGPYGQGGF